MTREGGVAAVVLAAGGGTRMKSGLPKVLHPAAGRPLLVHVLASVEPLEVEGRYAVISSRAEQFEKVLADSDLLDPVELVIQDPPRGTADAVKSALSAIGDRFKTILVLQGDSPLIQTGTLDALLHVHFDNSSSATVLTARISDPTGYGRIVRSDDGNVERIVEERDTSYEEREIDEINAGVYVFQVDALRSALEDVEDANAQGEYYLTDVVPALRSKGHTSLGYRTHPEEVLGVNSRAQLARVAELLRRRECDRLMNDGVTIVDPNTTYIDVSVQIARDATIHPFTFLEGRTSIGEGAEIGPQVRIVDSHIAEEATISFAVVRESFIGPQASVGPFASLRPGTRLERGARLGTFVESKNSTLGEDSKANHLSYLGDAQIGRGVNVGAGTITCNWDGTEKHATIIDDEAYIGSDTMLVAPTRVGKRAATGAGSVVTGDVPDEALAVGVPARIIEGKGNKMRPRDGNNEEEPRQ
ncbi:MAG TPA: bifunctional UDP-N-acetylglucosamine diphosphorylase/glucosamine-1-phosphate N-acetyltransferase GlmU [Actinomycetota bacterium]|nr:bifunctional UDP-N-acetylglucosamine diphosphorylase/glucosamine-1-phosphate N-acetyltransferase GlmU [Actinomycetota bacterium]